jgi:hypothetical protein
MASTINASTTLGLISTADTSGVLQLQTANTTAVTVNANQTVSLAVGTANGVTYLNGSKVLTSGSALTFDGTNLGVGSGAAINFGGSLVLYGDSTLTALRGRATNGIVFQDSSATEQMRLTSTGLGIGTSSPTEKLTVNGNIKLGTSGTSFIYGPSTTGRSVFSNSDSSAYMIAYGSSYGGSIDAGLQFSAGTTNIMVFNSSGNLGLGVTPSAWDTGIALKAFQFSATGCVYGYSFGGNNFTAISNNFYINSSGTGTYLTTNTASQYSQSAGQHRWFTAPSGTAGNAISFTQAMTLDASGRQLLGHTSSQGNNSRLQVSGSAEFFGSQGGNGPLTTLSFYNTNSSGFQIATMDVITGANFYEGIIRWQTKDAGGTVAERVRIDSSGNFGVGTSSPASYGGSAFTKSVNIGSLNTITAGFSDGVSGTLRIAHASGQNIINFDTSALCFQSGGSTPTERARITSTGNLLVGSTTNTTNSNLILTGATRWAVGTQAGGNLFYIVRDSDGVGQYMVNGSTSWTATSDERLKDIIEPISDAASKVSTLRAVIGKFKKDAEGTRRSFLIAQDVQAVLPEAVTIQEDEFGTLGIQYTEVIPLLVAAIKEQTTLIESLKARLDAANL